MKTRNKINLVLILCLSSHLLQCAQGKNSHVSHSSAPIPKKRSTPPSTTKKLLPNLEDPLLKKACNATDHPLLCLSSIGPFLPLGKIDPVSILQSEMKACLNHTIMLKDKATNIAANKSTPPNVVDNVQSCVELYQMIIDDLGKAEIKLPINEKDLSYGFSAGLALVTTCLDGYAEGVTSENPVADLDKILYQMFHNCLRLLHFIVPENWLT